MPLPRLKPAFFIIIFFLTVFLIFQTWQYFANNNNSLFVKFALFTKEKLIDFENSDNVTGFPNAIVPNIVHFIRFQQPNMTFVEMICIKAVYVNMNPSKIIIHCDEEPTGIYWNHIKNIPTIQIRYRSVLHEIFGKKIQVIQHASDIERIKILMEEGGIYLDNDVYVVRSLKPFLKFEFSVGWPEGQYIGNQVLIAHKNSRFLKEYYQSYTTFDDNKWYYNAGDYPTMSILWKKPYLVHREPELFGVQLLAHLLYQENNFDWKSYYCVHLLINHKYYLVKDDPIVTFDHNNIKSYKPPFGAMARLIYYGTENLLKQNEDINSTISPKTVT